MADGSVNIILNIPEPYREEAKRFMDWHHLLVGVSAVVVEQEVHIKKGWRTETE